MSDRRRRKKHEAATEPSKDELKLAKHVRFKTPKKATVMQKESVEYFVGSKAVDTIMNSKWSKPTKKGDPLIGNRDDAIAFMERLLKSRYFYRAKKVLKEPKVDKTKKTKLKTEDVKGSPKVRRRKEESEEKKDKSKKLEKDEKSEKSDKNNKKDKNEKSEEKKKKRYKLEVHDEQEFLDSNDVYIWLFDPLHPKTLLLGGVILLGVIAATLFPLWPPFVRVGVYYLSVVGGIFVGAILGTAVLRTVLFGVVWVGSMGKHHIWILPNLLADVGFFDSFKPFYTHDIKESKQKDKESDNEEEDDEVEEPEVEDAQPPEEEHNVISDQSNNKKDTNDVIAEPIADSEKDNSSGSDYEIITKGTAAMQQQKDQTSC